MDNCNTTGKDSLANIWSFVNGPWTVRESLKTETMGPISVRYACGVTNAQLAAAKKYVAYYKEGLAVPCTSYVKVNLLHDLRYVTYGYIPYVLNWQQFCQWLNLSERTSGEWPVTPKFFSTITLRQKSDIQFIVLNAVMNQTWHIIWTAPK